MPPESTTKTEKAPRWVTATSSKPRRHHHHATAIDSSIIYYHNHAIIATPGTQKHVVTSTSPRTQNHVTTKPTSWPEALSVKLPRSRGAAVFTVGVSSCA